MNYANITHRYFASRCPSATNIPSQKKCLHYLDTYDASNPAFTDLSVMNYDLRQWYWMLCNEPFGWWHRCVILTSSLSNLRQFWSPFDIIVRISHTNTKKDQWSTKQWDYYHFSHEDRRSGISRMLAPLSICQRVHLWRCPYRGNTVRRVNNRTGGWSFKDTERLILVNGYEPPTCLHFFATKPSTVVAINMTQHMTG